MNSYFLSLLKSFTRCKRNKLGLKNFRQKNSRIFSVCFDFDAIIEACMRGSCSLFLCKYLFCVQEVVQRPGLVNFYSKLKIVLHIFWPIKLPTCERISSSTKTIAETYSSECYDNRRSFKISLSSWSWGIYKDVFECQAGRIRLTLNAGFPFEFDLEHVFKWYK